MAYKINNNAKSKLQSDLDNLSTSLIVKDWEWQLFGDVFPIRVTIEQFWENGVLKREIVEVSWRQQDILMISDRAVEECVQNDTIEPKVMSKNNLSFQSNQETSVSMYLTADILQKIKDDVEKKLNIKDYQNGTKVYAASSSGTDNYSITLDPPVTTYNLWMTFKFLADVDNTASASLNVNGIGERIIKKRYNQDLSTWDIRAGQIVTVTYDGTNFQMDSQLALVPTTDIHTQTEKTNLDADDELLIYSWTDSGNKKTKIKNLEKYIKKFNKFELWEKVEKWVLVKFNDEGKLVNLPTMKQEQELDVWISSTNGNYYKKTFVNINDKYACVWVSYWNGAQYNDYHIFKRTKTWYEFVKKVSNFYNLAGVVVDNKLIKFEILDLKNNHFLFRYIHNKKNQNRCHWIVGGRDEATETFSFWPDYDFWGASVFNDYGSFITLRKNRFIFCNNSTLTLFKADINNKTINILWTPYTTESSKFCVRKNDNQIRTKRKQRSSFTSVIDVTDNGFSNEQQAWWDSLFWQWFYSVYSSSCGDYIVYNSEDNYTSLLMYWNWQSREHKATRGSYNNPLRATLLTDGGVDYVLFGNNVQRINKTTKRLEQTPHSSNGVGINALVWKNLFMRDVWMKKIAFEKYNTTDFVWITQEAWNAGDSVETAILGEISTADNDIKPGKNYWFGLGLANNKLLIWKY